MYDQKKSNKALDQYLDAQTCWNLKTYLKFRSMGARFCVELHSTEKVLDVMGQPKCSDEIHLYALHNLRSRRMPRFLGVYSFKFRRKFRDHEFHFVGVHEDHPDIVTLEFYNNPRYVRKSIAENMLRHFLSYMVGVV